MPIPYKKDGDFFVRESVGFPAGILVYVSLMVLLLIIFRHVFVAAQEWSRLITFLTSSISFVAACTAAEKFSNLTGVKIFAAFVALFWLIFLGADFLGVLTDVIDFLEGDSNEGDAIKNLLEFVKTVWRAPLCFVVTLILTLWTVTK